jgi:hypothetical protein
VEPPNRAEGALALRSSLAAPPRRPLARRQSTFSRRAPCRGFSGDSGGGEWLGRAKGGFRQRSSFAALARGETLQPPRRTYACHVHWAVVKWRRQIGTSSLFAHPPHWNGPARARGRPCCCGGGGRLVRLIRLVRLVPLVPLVPFVGSEGRGKESGAEKGRRQVGFSEQRGWGGDSDQRAAGGVVEEAELVFARRAASLDADGVGRVQQPRPGL